MTQVLEATTAPFTREELSLLLYVENVAVEKGGRLDKGREVALALLETLAALEEATHPPKALGFGFGARGAEGATR